MLLVFLLNRHACDFSERESDPARMLRSICKKKAALSAENDSPRISVLTIVVETTIMVLDERNQSLRQQATARGVS